MPGVDDQTVDLPLAVAEAAALYTIHTDQLGRPIRMTNGAKTTVWQATYKPWGEVQSISGTTTNNLRFPGQYFQIETGMHYNWHRNYDPVTGRYTQPDPLGFVDGPSVYAYGMNSPIKITDRTDLNTPKDYPHSEMPKTDNGAQVCDDDWDWCHNHCWARALVNGKNIQPLYGRCMNACLGFRPL